MNRNLSVAIVVAVGIVALWSGPDEAAPATVNVLIDGPEGGFWNGSVAADPGTAFHALLAASLDGGFTVDWSGTGESVYVTEINGWAAGSSGGWCFQVDSGSGLADSPRSAGAVAMLDGWSVRWYWTGGNCDQF